MLKGDEVVMYSGEQCGYCVRARRLLEKKGVAFREIKIDRSPELRAEMERLSQRRTIPQIFIHGQHIGGFDDMAALDSSGELDKLLSVTRRT
ncbi:MAG: glutaredoxin 3 [Gammaproteobacteria bacterium]|nr:glutaredoxin 3 [Gammaproteobacteria bacterium]